MIKRILAVGAVLAILAATAVMAFAESAAVTVTAGTLSLTTNAVALPGITLSGADQTTATTAGDDTYNVADGRGSGAGYNVTIDTTDFTDGGSTIDTGTGDFDISLQNSDIVDGRPDRPSRPDAAIREPPPPHRVATVRRGDHAAEPAIPSGSVRPSFSIAEAEA